MTSTSQNGVKSGFFVISGRNSGEIEGEFQYYLKKQSQFAKGQMGLNIANTKVYEKTSYRGIVKNKANSRPIKANFRSVNQKGWLVNIEYRTGNISRRGRLTVECRRVSSCLRGESKMVLIRV